MMSRPLVYKLISVVLLGGLTGAFATNTNVYVSNISGNNVSVVNPSTGQVLAMITVPTGPNGIAVTPDGTAVYVVSQSTNNVSVISTATNKITSTITVGTTPVRIAINPAGTAAYVVNQGSNSVSVIPIPGASVVATIPVGSHPAGITFSPDGSRAYVGNVYGGTVSVINTATNTVTGTMTAGSGPNAVAVSPSGSYAYVSNQYSNSVTVHALPAGNIVATVAGFSSPNGVAVTPSGNYVFVTNGNGSSVSVIDTSTNKIATTISTGMTPTAVAISTDGSQAYVTNEYAFTLSMISTSTLALTGSIAKVGVYPIGVATVPAGSSTACTYSISPGGASFGSSGGTGSVSVTAPAGCSWTAASNVPWASVTSGSSGSGNGTVNYAVNPDNTINGQTGTLTIGGQTFNIMEGGITCSYTISPTSASLGSSGGTGSVTVTSPSGCNWTAVSNAAFLSVTSGASGTGTGTVNYSATANTGINPQSGTLTIAGQTFTVTESGIACTYSLSSNSASFGSAGGSGTVNVTAPSGCMWSAVNNSPGFLSISSGASGSGNGSVGYSSAPNSGLTPETGTLTIAGQTFTVTEAGITCTYTLSGTSASLGSGGGTGSVTVTAPTGCTWTASSNAGFLTVTSGASGNGNGTVAFSAAANPGLSVQSGTLTVAAQTFTVTEAGDAFSPIFVNCGGAAFTDSNNNVWAADNVGNISSTTNTIANTTTAALYRSDKWSTSTLQYQYTVPDGSYNVTLKFAEFYLTQPGQRQFNIVINGTTVQSAFDILAYAAVNTAYDLTFPVSVSNGQITIQLVPVVGTAKLNALEIAAQ